MLKKQTVWLLTMLSLIIVLSVYYMTSPTPSPQDPMALSADHKKDQKQNNKQDANKKDEQTSAQSQQDSVSTNIADEATFAAAKVKKMDARSKLSEQLTNTIASKTATAEEQAKAESKLKQLEHLSSEEKMIESLIVAKGFNDALVNVDGKKVRIYVEAKSLSNKQAAQILDLVETKLNMNTHDIYVTYKPGSAE
ncbi:MAG TPA: SpoIIIAH-like family protein [Bacillales bacterium]|nr:SpoIIIAH-like family protein [Bacillales bacterium]